MRPGKASSTMASISESVAEIRSFGSLTSSYSGTPSIRAVAMPLVATLRLQATTAGLPAASSVRQSCTLHDAQGAQSPMAAITTSALDASSDRTAGGANLVGSPFFAHTTSRNA